MAAEAHETKIYTNGSPDQTSQWPIRRSWANFLIGTAHHPLSHPDKEKLKPLLLSSSFSLMETTLVIAIFRESDSLKKQELIKLWSLNTQSRTRYISLKKDIIRCSSSMIAVSNQAFNVCTQLEGLNNLLLNFSFNFFNGVRLIPFSKLFSDRS